MRWIFLFLSFYPLFFHGMATTQIQLNDQILTVEIADTEPALEHGLMGRKTLKAGHGMLFIYKKPLILSFWMKNTLIPLSIGFFDAAKKLINTADMDPPKRGSTSFATYKSARPALYALEVPQGWFAENRIEPGMKFSFLDRETQVK